MEKALQKHGDSHPKLFEVQKSFTTLCEVLHLHIHPENNILFPPAIEMEKTGQKELAVSGKQ
ncbi:MAG: hypothetical protein R2681_01595 [Pyrinomonadaceae bacterium]